MDRFVYILFSVFIFVLKIIPRSLRKGFFAILEKILFLIAKKNNKIIEKNLKFVYPDISRDEIVEIQKYFYHNLLLWGRTLVENLTISDEELKSMVELENLEIFEKLKKENKKIILISAHFGNIEMMGTYFSKFISTGVQVVRQSKNPYIDNFLVESRESSGSQIVFRKGALRSLMKAMKEDKIVSLITDQAIRKSNGQEVLFLGKKAYQTRAPSILARKFDAVILPMAMFNLSEDKYKLKFYEPIKPIKTDDEKEDLAKHSQLQADVLSKIINEDRKQWFWGHKRFKGFYSEIYE